MGRRVFGAFLTCVLALAAVPEACLACSCLLASPEQARRQASVIFVGRPVLISSQRVRPYFKPDEPVVVTRIVFLVERTWTNDERAVVSVRTSEWNGTYGSDVGCLPAFVFGEPYLVYARIYDWNTYILGTSFCSGTMEAEKAQPYLDDLGPGSVLTPAIDGTITYGLGLSLAVYDLVQPMVETR